MHNDTIYIIDGSFEGFLSAVFRAYNDAAFPARVAAGSDYEQPSLFCDRSVPVATDLKLARRVQAGILKTIGPAAYEQCWLAHLSAAEDRYTKLLAYLRYGFQAGRATPNALGEPCVAAVFELQRAVWREYGKIIGFVRFSVLDNGAQYSRIEPVHRQLPLLMPHFADRFHGIPFVLYDARHNEAGLYDTRRWRICEAQGFAPPPASRGEQEARALWKRFFNAIAIDERRNKKLQRQLMPKRYWSNMLETS